MQQFFDTLTDASGNALYQAVVTVTNYPSGTLASIYSTNGTANPIANSAVVSDITGQISFWAPDGAYTLSYAYKSVTYKTRSPVQICDQLGFVPFQDTGVANAYAVTDARLSTQLYTNLRVTFIAANAGGGAVTFALNATGAQSVLLPGGGQLSVNAILANGIYTVLWNGTYWELISTPSFNANAVASILFPRTATEIIAGVTPVQFSYLPGVVDRYQVNAGASGPTPTDMATGVNAAISQMLAGGAPVRFLAGAYYIGTALSFVTSANIQPIDIGGAGDVLTQLICGIPTGAHSQIQGGLFNMASLNGWYIHDLLICGADTNAAVVASTNPGIVTNSVGGTESISWRIERVTSLMPGHGVVCADTNTGAIQDFRHWPGNNPTLIVPQSVSNSNRGHGIYLTGGFAHNISIINANTPPDAQYFSGNQRGIKCDANFSFGCSIIMPLVQGISGLNSETGIDWNASTTEGLSVVSPYHEGAILAFKNMQNSEVIGATDGAVLGSIVLSNNARFNRFSACNVNTINISDNTCIGNEFVACNARAVFTDATEGSNLSAQPNSYLACTLWNGSAAVQCGSLGLNWRKILTYSASMSADTYGPNHLVIRANNATAFTITPAHPRNGQTLEITIRNEQGSGALGAITWTSTKTPASVPSPAAGFNRTYWLEWDSDFAFWYMIDWSPADVAN